MNGKSDEDPFKEYREAAAQVEDPKYISQRDIFAVVHGIQHIAADLNKGYLVRQPEHLKLMVDTMLLFMEGLVPKQEASNAS